MFSGQNKNRSDFDIINEKFSKKLIKRSPDKMIDYIREEDRDYVLLAYRNTLIAIDVTETEIKK